MFDGEFKMGKFHRGKLLAIGKYFNDNYTNQLRFYEWRNTFQHFFSYLQIFKLYKKMDKSCKIMNDKMERIND